MLDDIRDAGNEAVHDYSGDQQKAHAVVAALFKLGVWWYEIETGLRPTHTYTPPTRTTSVLPYQTLKNIDAKLKRLEATLDRSMQPKAWYHTTLPVAGGVFFGGTLLVFVLVIIVCTCCMVGSLLPNGPDDPRGAESPQSSTPAATRTASSRPAATTTASARPDGVIYRCTGSAPRIDINYGPSGGGTQATKLPFTARGDIHPSASSYSIHAQLLGSGHVTCTLTVTDSGITTTNTRTASGGYNSASPRICRNYEGIWNPCG